MQSRFDIAQARKRAGEITVARYVPKPAPAVTQQTTIFSAHFETLGGGSLDLPPR